jgi:hypothetical protein
VAATLTAVYVAEVALEILVKVTLLEDDCHWIVPTELLSVSRLLFTAEHTVVPPEMVPPLEVGSTVMVEEAE